MAVNLGQIQQPPRLRRGTFVYYKILFPHVFTNNHNALLNKLCRIENKLMRGAAPNGINYTQDFLVPPGFPPLDQCVDFTVFYWHIRQRKIYCKRCGRSYAANYYFISHNCNNVNDIRGAYIRRLCVRLGPIEWVIRSLAFYGKDVLSRGKVNFRVLPLAIGAKDVRVTFANAHLSMSASNGLFLLGYGLDAARQVIFDSRSASKENIVPHTSEVIIDGIRKLMEYGIEAKDSSRHSSLAPALAHGLAYLNTCNSLIDSSATYASTSTENKQAKNDRILIISMRDEIVTEHSQLMNLFFTANKYGLCVDVVSFGDPSPLLQQAADITGGLCLRVSKPKELLKNLMAYVLCPPSLRPSFCAPVEGVVDYRAACICHHGLVDQAWICSVCLAIMCRFTPICKVCGAVFPVNLPTKKAKKRPGAPAGAAQKKKPP